MLKREEIVSEGGEKWTRFSYDELDRISKGSMMENFWKYVERSTGKRSLSKFSYQRTMLTLLSMIPTVFGSMLRGIAYKAILGSVGSNCLIERNIRFNIPQKFFLGNRIIVGESNYFDIQTPEGEIRINDDVRIGRYNTFRAGPGNISIEDRVAIGAFGEFIGSEDLKIGKNTLIARNVLILSGTHIYKDPSIPIKYQGSKLASVNIGEDVWVGANVVVFPGVTIGDGSVVGAGAVVKNDIPPYSVAVGNPAKVIKKRS